MHRLLTVVEAGGAKGVRLVTEGKRLCKRVNRFAKMGQVSLKDRGEQAAELLISLAEEFVKGDLLERATKILREMPQRSTKMDEAKLLADAVNLDDFGITGLVMQAMQLAKQNAGVEQVADGFEKRREYGYWEARLKDGFFFDAVRKLAIARLRRASEMVDLLLNELREDQAL